jgi:hypothetical protein
MKPFRAVSTTEAQEGMRLYEDVRDRAGNVLLPRLTVLTGAMLGSLLRRDVDVVLVVDDTVTPAQRAAERERVQARLATLFRHAGTGRANVLLRMVVERYRMAELS